MMVSRTLNQPEPGWWLVRLVKGGPLAAACIRVVHTTCEPGNEANDMTGTRSPFLAAFVNDEPVDMDRVWMTRGEPITEAEYKHRCAVAAWAKAHAPNDPAAKPHKRVDLMTAALPF